MWSLKLYLSQHEQSQITQCLVLSVTESEFINISVGFSNSYNLIFTTWEVLYISGLKYQHRLLTSSFYYLISWYTYSNLFQVAFTIEISCNTTFLTTLSLSWALEFTYMETSSTSSEIKTSESQQRAFELLKTSLCCELLIMETELRPYVGYRAYLSSNVK